MSHSSVKLKNRLVVGEYGDFKTIKSAVDWFNSYSDTDYEIMLDSGHHLITDTIIVNAGNYLQIRGQGSAVCFLDASTGLTGKPMFNFKSYCDIKQITADGSTLTDYGTLSNENFITFDTNSNIYSEITDIFINNFNIAIADLIGVDFFIFNFEISNCISAGI